MYREQLLLDDTNNNVETLNKMPLHSLDPILEEIVYLVKLAQSTFTPSSNREEL